MAKRDLYSKYVENAHAKQNRALRTELATLQQKISQMELDSKVQSAQAKLKEVETKQDVARAKPFIDNQSGKGRKKKA